MNTPTVPSIWTHDNGTTLPQRVIDLICTPRVARFLHGLNSQVLGGRRVHRKHGNAFYVHTARQLHPSFGIHAVRAQVHLQVLNLVDTDFKPGSHTMAYEFAKDVQKFLNSKQFHTYLAEVLSRPAPIPAANKGTGAKGVLTMFEEFSLSAVIAIAEGRHPTINKPYDVTVAKSLLSNYRDETQDLLFSQVDYYKTNALGLGRNYSHGNNGNAFTLQTISSDMRDAILHDHFSMDLKNSLPSLLDQLTHGKYPSLHDYVVRRDEYLAMVSEAYAIDRDASKKILLAGTFGASYRRAAKNNPDSSFSKMLAQGDKPTQNANYANGKIAEAHAWMCSYTADVRAAYKEISSRPEHIALRDACTIYAAEGEGARPAGHWRNEGAVSAIFLQTLEARYMESLVFALQSVPNITVSALLHDEVFINLRGSGMTIEEGHTRVCEVLAAVERTMEKFHGFSPSFSTTYYA